MRSTAAVIGSMLLLFASPSLADQMTLGLRVGAAFPTGNFKEELADNGGSVGGTLDWMYNPGAGLGIDVVYHSLGGGPNPDAEIVGGPGSTFAVDAWQVTGHYLRVGQRTSLAPWFKLGLGAYTSRMQVHGGQTESDNRNQSFGLEVALGVESRLKGAWKLGLGGSYHHFQRLKVPPPSQEPGSPLFGGPDTGAVQASGFYSIDVTMTRVFGGHKASRISP